MQKFLTLKTLILFVVFLVIITVLLLVVVLQAARSSSTPNPENGNGSNQQPPDGPTTGLENPIELASIVYAGINDQDNLVFIDQQGVETVTSLSSRSWQDMSWSTDGSLVAVLGNTATPGLPQIFNLFIFNFSRGVWEQVTFYSNGENGVSGYAWQDNDTIAFSQGLGDDLWLHTYNYPNTELKKVFKVPGKLSAYFVDAQQYLISNDGGVFRLFDKQGQLVRRFEARQDLGLAEAYTAILPGRTEYEVLLQVNSVWYIWDFDAAEYRLLNTLEQEPDGQVALWCARDLMLFVASNSQNQIGLYNPETAIFRQLTIDGVDFAIPQEESLQQLICRNGAISLIKAENWYVPSAQGLEKLDLRYIYVQLVPQI